MHSVGRCRRTEEQCRLTARQTCSDDRCSGCRAARFHAPRVRNRTSSSGGTSRSTGTRDHRTTIGVDAEPKLLLAKPSGDPGWATSNHALHRIQARPMVRHRRRSFSSGGRTKPTIWTPTELTPRIGFRLHLLSNLRDDLTRERRPKHRLVLRDFLRFEYRNLYYSTDKPGLSHSVRLRNRIGGLCGRSTSTVSPTTTRCI